MQSFLWDNLQQSDIQIPFEGGEKAEMVTGWRETPQEY